MYLENNLRLLPLVILLAALTAGLIIAFASHPAALFPYALAVAAAILLAAGILAAVCGLRRSADTCGCACAAVHCMAPVVVAAAVLSVALALVVIAGFSVTPVVNAALGVVYALIFSTMLVYFADMCLEML